MMVSSSTRRSEEKNPRDLQGMNEIGLAGKPFLTVVDLRREDVRALQPLQVDLRIVVEHAIGNVVESKHTKEKSLESRWVIHHEGR